MEQILASLIIACSNITQTSNVFNDKKECIYRVTTCASLYKLDLKKKQTPDPVVFTLKCSKEVY